MKVNRERLRRIADVRLACTLEEEDYNAAIPDDEAVAWIGDQLLQGNTWAWCIAIVTAKHQKLEAFTTLSMCSYKSQEDFEKNGPYEDMVEEVIDELAEQIEALVTDHDIWEHDGDACLWCVVS